MGAKATFNAITRIIKLTEAPSLVDGEYQVSLDVQADLYGDMKEDWLNTPSLRKLIPPISAVGGNPLPGAQKLGDTYFLRSDWKIEPYDADQRLTVVGNLYSEDGTSPFIKPSGGTYAVQIERSVSNLVDTVIPTSVSGGIKKNTAKNNFSFLMVLASNHITPATGKSITAQRSIDGASFSACDNVASEVSNGIYVINLTANDTNGDVITYLFTAASCDPRYITVVTGQ